MREMDIFQYEPKGAEYVISKVSDKEGWREVKETLLKSVGMGSMPVTKVADADHGHNRVLYLTHDHDGGICSWSTPSGRWGMSSDCGGMRQFLRRRWTARPCSCQ